MSYTMTIDAPEKVVSYVTRNGTCSRDELGRLFVAFLVERMGYVPDDEDEAEVPSSRLVASFHEADEMEAGLRPRQDFKTVEDLMADCLA